MKTLFTRLLFVNLLIVVCSFTTIAQFKVTGTVRDGENGDPLAGATVTRLNNNHTVITNAAGRFEIDLPVSSPTTLVFKFLGYSDIHKKITTPASHDLGIIEMQINPLILEDVTITSSIATNRKTPIAQSTLEPVFIEERIGMRDLPELLKFSPGMYVVKGGGGYGDTEVIMRGFKKENVAVMVNGVPMNDMENGTVYWSNWTSLSDVTRHKQVQRGLGASKVSAPSVGGSINIVTNSIEAEKGGFVTAGTGQDGYRKIQFSVSSGLSENGWAMTFMGGREWGDGYIQGTEYDSYNYFINIAKRLNYSHQLSLTAFGAPQWHNQRSSYDGLTIKGWQEVKKYMKPDEQYRYNPTYGFDKNGQRKAANKNKYHKPQISLNHMWQIDTKSSLSTAMYVSIGEGWGNRGEGNNGYGNSSWFGANNGQLTTLFRNADGTFAYDKIQELNENSNNGSQMVMTVSKNGHRWFGLLSTYTKELNDNLNFYAGIDGRYYIGKHTNELTDLYNGEYYIDPYRSSVKTTNNAAAANPEFNTQKLTIGDVVRRNYDGHVLQGGLFGQIEYNNEAFSAFISTSVSHSHHWRYDRFYYDKANAESEKVGKVGFTVKGGANYNLNEHHNVFANIGCISRAPFLDGGIFLSIMNSNIVNPDPVNEKVFSFEIGYGYKSKYVDFNLNAYHTNWNDKTMTNYQDITMEDNSIDRATINMQGVNATHQGIELEVNLAPFHWLDLQGMFSVGNWRWSNNPTGYWYNSSGQPLKNNKGEIASEVGAEDHAKSTLELDGVKVGNSAQTTTALGVNIKPMKSLRFSLDWNWAGRIYADYSLSGANLGMGSAVAFKTPWRIPSASTVDFSAGYSFKLGEFNTTLFGNITNLFNQEYIQSARDGSEHNWETADRIYYGFGRQLSVKLKVEF